MTKIVDASAVAALLFEEPGADEVERRLGHDRLGAPELLLFEVANVCVTKLRRSPEDRERLLEAFATLPELQVRPVRVDYAEVVALAMEGSLTAYDASYLWAARAMGAELITLDRRLAAVAKVQPVQAPRTPG